jgi:alpha-glucosidase
VTDENATSVSIYLPKDRFYDFATLAPVDGTGQYVTLSNISFSEIPLHIRGGAVLPLRAAGAMTTTELRKQDFQFIVAPGTDGTANGTLYVDDGVSLRQTEMSSVELTYANGKLSVLATGSFDIGVNVASVWVLGVEKAPKTVSGPSEWRDTAFSYDAERKVLQMKTEVPLERGFEVSFS